jgi:transposase
MLPPNNVVVPELAGETGIPKDTLCGWRRGAQAGAAQAKDSSREGLSSEERFNVVLETASLNEVELGEYCRRKGLFAQQIQAWRETCRQAHVAPIAQADRQELHEQAKAIKGMERELRRKDKALAEAAALLVFQKKPAPSRGKPRPNDRADTARQGGGLDR